MEREIIKGKTRLTTEGFMSFISNIKVDGSYIVISEVVAPRETKHREFNIGNDQDAHKVAKHIAQILNPQTDEALELLNEYDEFMQMLSEKYNVYLSGTDYNGYMTISDASGVDVLGFNPNSCTVSYYLPK